MIPQYTDLERFFNINSEDGLITTMKPLDRETQAWHNISVSATEIGTHKRQTLPTIEGNWDWIWRAWALKTSKQRLWLIMVLLPRSDLLRKVKSDKTAARASLLIYFQPLKLQSVSVWSCWVLLKVINFMMQRENVKMREQMENFQPEGLSAVLDAQLFSYLSANIARWCMVHWLM